MIERYLTNKTNWLLVLFFLSLPFERLLTLEVAGYTVKTSYMLGIIIIACFVVAQALACSRQKHTKVWATVRLAQEEKYLLLFVLTSYLTTLWSIDPKRTLIISSAFFLMALIFIVVRRLINDENRERFENIIIWLGVGTSIFALWQFLAGSIPSLNSLAFLRPQYQSGIFGFPRVQSTFLEPQYFANFLILPLLLAVKKLISGRKAGNYIYLGLISLALFLTLSRGAEYALIIALLILTLVIYGTDRLKLKSFGLAILTILGGVIVGTLMILAVAGTTGVRNYFGQAITTTLTTDEGITDRSSTSEVAYRVFLSNPLGIGSGAFGALPIYKDQIASRGYQIVNNEYLEILAEDGVFGMLFFGLFILALMVYLIREIKNGHKEAVFLLAAAVAMLIQYLVFSTLYFAYLWVFLAVIWPTTKVKSGSSS